MRTALLLALFLAPPLQAQTATDTLRGALEARIRASGATVGLYFQNLNTPDSLTIGADARFHAASTMKIAVMVQVFRDADAGRLRLRDEIEVVNRFRSLADTSTFTLDAGDDSDSTLYEKVGRRVRISELVELMIRVSSNLATNILIDRVGAERVQATLRQLGADSVQVRRGVEDGAAFRAGMNNTATARGLGVLLALIANGEAASAVSCGAMLDILLGQRFRDAIPAGLPRRTRVAHKTGTITGAHHDAAVVYLRDRPAYVLVIMTRGLEQQVQSAGLIADLTRLVHGHFVPGTAGVSVRETIAGIEFMVDSATDLTPQGPSALVSPALRVVYAGNRGRIDVLASPARPVLRIGDIVVGPSPAAAGDYYLFDDTSFTLVRPATGQYTTFRLAHASFNYRGQREGWPQMFRMTSTRADTVREAQPQLTRAEANLYWHLDIVRDVACTTINCSLEELARGRMTTADAPASELLIARWIGPAAALAGIPRGVDRLSRRPIRVTTVSPVTGIHHLRDVRDMNVDPRDLALPADYREAIVP